MLAEPDRTPGGHRVYPPETVTALRVIKALLAALAAGCDDLITCADTPSCPLPFADLADTDRPNRTQQDTPRRTAGHNARARHTAAKSRRRRTLIAAACSAVVVAAFAAVVLVMRDTETTVAAPGQQSGGVAGSAPGTVGTGFPDFALTNVDGSPDHEGIAGRAEDIDLVHRLVCASAHGFTSSDLGG